MKSSKTYLLLTCRFRTSKVNLVFAAIPQLNCISGSDKQKQYGIKTILSSYVGTTRFELATPCTPCKCATGLRYVPNSSGLQM